MERCHPQFGDGSRDNAVRQPWLYVQFAHKKMQKPQVHCLEMELGALGIKGWQWPASRGKSRTVPGIREDRGSPGSYVAAQVRICGCVLCLVQQFAEQMVLGHV